MNSSLGTRASVLGADALGGWLRHEEPACFLSPENHRTVAQVPAPAAPPAVHTCLLRVKTAGRWHWLPAPARLFLCQTEPRLACCSVDFLYPSVDFSCSSTDFLYPSVDFLSVVVGGMSAAIRVLLLWRYLFSLVLSWRFCSFTTRCLSVTRHRCFKIV